MTPTSAAPGTVGRPPRPAAGRLGLDPWLVLPCLTLACLGLVLVYSSSAVWAARQHRDAAHFLRLQAVWLGLGAAALGVAARLPAVALRRRCGWLFVLTLVALALVLVPGVGRWVGGARRWLVVGGISCQPAEAAKLSTVALLAALLGRPAAAPGGAGGARLWLPALLAQLPVALVLCEPDLGAAVVIELVTLGMLFVAGLRPRALVVLGLMGLPLLYHLVVGTPFRLARLLSFLDPWAFRSTSGYQVTEALISLGSGGLWGVGLGQGKQKLFFLPEAHTDFIFASLGEELGLAGALTTLALFALITGRGLWVAERAGGRFQRLLAVGLVLMLAVPVAMNLAVACGLMPTKGLPLPLLSYGGSHTLVSMTAVGLLSGLSAATPPPAAVAGQLGSP